MKNSDNDEDDEHGDEIICLIVEQIIVDSVCPFVNVVKVWRLKSGFGKDELIQAPHWSNLNSIKYFEHFLLVVELFVLFLLCL